MCSFLLSRCGQKIKQNEITPLVRATSFLHNEYENTYYWWEPVALLQRLLVTGFVVGAPPLCTRGRTITQ